MFEIKVSNSVRNQTQHIPGKFGSFDGSTFNASDCSAGMLAVRHSLIPSEGYESIVDGNSKPKILNGNTWFMTAAADGAAGGAYGDHTGIFAFDNYETSSAQSGDNRWFVGMQTLGQGLPKGERGDFCEIIIGEQYAFGTGNFTDDPVVGEFAVIEDGYLTPENDTPDAGTGVYFKVLRKLPVNEGTFYWGDAYVLEAARTLEAAEG